MLLVVLLLCYLEFVRTTGIRPLPLPFVFQAPRMNQNAPNWIKEEARAWAPWIVKTPLISIIIIKGPDIFLGGNHFTFSMRMGVLTVVIASLILTSGVMRVGDGVERVGDGIARVGDGIARVGDALGDDVSVGTGLKWIGLGIGAVAISNVIMSRK